MTQSLGRKDMVNTHSWTLPLSLRTIYFLLFQKKLEICVIPTIINYYDMSFSQYTYTASSCGGILYCTVFWDTRKSMSKSSKPEKHIC